MNLKYRTTRNKTQQKEQMNDGCETKMGKCKQHAWMECECERKWRMD